MHKFIHAALFLIILTATGCVSQPTAVKKDTRKTWKTLYNTIIIEVQPVKSTAPTRQTFEMFAELLEEYKICRKKDVLIVYKDPVQFDIFIWPSDMVRTFEELHRAIPDTNSTDRNFTVFVSYLNGLYGEPDMLTVAGLQYGWSSIAIFGGYSGQAGATLLLHEFGHLIGLVNRKHREGEPANPDRKSHCNNRRCIMYWRWNKKGKLCDLCVRDIEKIIARKNKGISGPL